jgi:hypothetical protein
VIIGKLIPAGSGFGVVKGAPLTAGEEASLAAVTAGGAATVEVEAVEAATDEEMAELMAAGFVPALAGNGAADEGDDAGEADAEADAETGVQDAVAALGGDGAEA